MPANSSAYGPPRPPALIPNVRPSAAAVTGAIKRAAQSTGVNFGYLLATAKVESNLDPNLTMQSSSATGLFQIIDQTWLGAMKTAGRAFGFGRYADAITQTKSGRYVVEDPVLRDEMMKLRKDPATNAVMGGVITQQNAAIVARRIGRKPTEGELYVAHFFGPYAASKVIEVAASAPNTDAAAMFPEAARANRAIFYDRAGNARTVAGVRDELVRRYQVAKARSAPAISATAVAQQTPNIAPTKSPTHVAPTRRVADTHGMTRAIAAAQAAPAADTAAQPRSAFYSLFGTEGPRGAISPVVAELWTPHANTQTGGRGAPLDHLYQEPSPRDPAKGS